jgi:uncharacterized protein (TIGR03067 family)
MRTRTIAFALTLALTFILIPALALILTLGLAGGGDSTRNGANSARGRANELLGEWELVESETAGKKHTFTPGAHVFVFGPKKVRLPAIGGEKAQEATYHLGTAAEPEGPRPIDITGQAGKSAGKTVHMIFAIKGNTLRMCACNRPGVRPVGFSAADDPSCTLLTLRRPTQ